MTGCPPRPPPRGAHPLPARVQRARRRLWQRMAVLQGAGARAPLGRSHGSVLGLAPGGTGQDSCPLPPSAVPNSHRGRRGTGDHPLPPPTSRVMPVCWEAPLAFCARGGWNWVWGQNELRALVSPCPHQQQKSRRPWAVEKEYPPASTPSSALSIPTMVVAAPRVQGAEGEGKSHHVSLGSDACLGGPNPARPCVGGSGGGGG